MPASLVEFLLLTAVAAQPADAREGRIAPLAKAHRGRVAVAVKDLETGETYSLMGDEAMPTASLIKFPVMVEVYQLVAEGKVKLTDPVTLREQDKVPGS